ncbi:alkylation response protein AidB-like acyl-CoA dehydrogenase [Salsuginibacillus halophilus]|uniref:Alkylation response protein AidB-like acyl-CoA dehydrogenase n=1 Tax=Salsuginibacillus halophilus TaxID=517424 RepID=A0A2P8HBL1_9BACI|nr:acyl-CoA dehydrogenase family protein [Salsuginibacillus halophilus]PSL43614.1 alkylation response protein AidB-like acyl-CoA dehydrogenase [Salsuginibacillus halophilus]
MIQMKQRGGSFLIEPAAPEDTVVPDELTDEQQMIKKTARAFSEEQVEPAGEAIENQDFDKVVSLLKQAGELGLLGHSVPEAYGGLGLDKVSKAIVGEAVGRTGAYGVAHANHTCIATLPITYYGTEAQKAYYLPKLADGRMVGAYCLTEPDAGSDALAAKTTAVLNGEESHYILNGAKIYITNAAFSDTFIVYAKVDQSQFTAFIVEKDTPGLVIGPEEKKMGIKGSSTCEVRFENAEVPVENVLGEVGRGHTIAFTVLNLGRYNLGAACTGAAEHALNITLTQVNERKQFRRKLSQFAATKDRLLGMGVRLFTSEAVQYRTAGLMEGALGDVTEETPHREIASRMGEFALECAAAKVYGSEAFDDIVDDAVQLHGGAGYIQEYRIERMYRDARINRIFEGTNEINRLLLTGQFMKKALKGELAYEPAVAAAFQHLQTPLNAPQAEDAIERMRALFLALAEESRKAYGESLEEEQHLLMQLAELAIELYAAESAWIRGMRQGENSMQAALAELSLEEAGRKVQTVVSKILLAFDDSVDKSFYRGAVPLFESNRTLTDRRDIVDRWSDKQRYDFNG